MIFSEISFLGTLSGMALKLPPLWRIELSSIQLKPEEFINLCNFVSKNEALRELKLTQMSLSDKEMLRLGASLNAKESLTVLNVKRNFIHGNGMQSLLGITKPAEECDVELALLNGMLHLFYFIQQLVEMQFTELFKLLPETVCKSQNLL